MMTTTSLTTELFKSRRYDFATGTFSYASPMVDLVAEIEAECAARGLTLSRWQANKGNHATTITYAVHTGTRAAQFRYQPDETVIDYCRLTSLEGTTARCEAYKALSAMLAEVRSAE
jgi:hypothetical protein